MEMSEKDQRLLRALDKALGQHAELEALLGFYYDLYEVQFLAKAGLLEPEVRDELAMHWRLEGGIPQLSFDQLRIDVESYEELVERVTSVLLRHNPEWAFEEEDSTPEGLMDLAREVYETWDTLTVPRIAGDKGQHGRADSPKAMAVGFALAPYLQKAAEMILPHLDLTLWTKGYCPVCGGRPNFAVLEEESGARQLMCSRCAALWPHSRLECPFCDTEERPMYYASDDDVHRLYVCHACKRYVKTVDLRKAQRVVFPMVERLVTIGMDLAAQREGYGD
jgi:FdhE protein